jgi:hypothetical protein
VIIDSLAWGFDSGFAFVLGDVGGPLWRELRFQEGQMAGIPGFVGSRCALLSE